MDVSLEFKKVNSYIEEGEYELAFSVLEEIISNNSSSNKQIAEAFNLKGVIVSGFAPYLGSGDETGISFYKRSIKYDEKCVGALLNIVSGYSSDEYCDSSMHSDRVMYVEAFNLLSSLPNDAVSNDQKEFLNKEKTRFYEEIKKS